MPDPSYLSDAPLSTRDGDRFDRWPFAERVAHVLRDRREASSLVVGLYGGWGEGKTTTLNFIEAALKDAGGVVVVRFNPWRFGNEATLIRNFFGALASAVSAKLTTKGEDFAKVASKYAGILSVGGFGLTLDAEKAAEAFAEVDLDELRTRLTDALAEANLRVVVRVDDIDRLDKDEVQTVFRLVKLSADFEHVAYVLALDPDVVAAALQERYGPGQPRAGYDFLEKIVTVPLHLPPARPQALYALCMDAVNEALRLADVFLDDRRFTGAFQTGLLPAMRTPRMAKRYGNAVRFALPLLKGEVDASDQLLIEGMRVVYPALYEHVRSHTGVYLRNAEPLDFFGSSDQSEKQEQREKEIESIVSQHAPHHPTSALALVKHLFPRSAGGTDNTNASRDQRASSAWYVDRYFTYAVSGDEVPDRDFSAAIELAEAGEAAASAAALRRLTRDATEERVLEMLRARAASGTSNPEGLARAISLVSDTFSFRRSAFMFPYETFLASSVVDLVSEIQDDDNRDRVLTEIVQTAPSVLFAMHVQGWASPIEDGRGVGFASPELDQTLVGVLAERIAEGAVSEAPHLATRERAPWMYRVWADGHTATDVQTYLRDRLADDPDEVDALLLSMTPHGVTGDSEPFPRRFGQNEYDSAAEYANPADVYEALKKVYPEDVLNAGYLNIDYVGSEMDGYKGVTIAEALARLFVVAHTQAPERPALESTETAGERARAPSPPESSS